MADTAQFDTLFTIAEMAVAMFSVAGLIAVFLTKGVLQPADRLRFLMIVIPGIMVAVFAFVPVWVARYVPSGSLWQVSSIIFFVTAAVFLTLGTLGARDEARQLFETIPRPVTFIPTIIALFNIVMISTNAIGWPIPSNQTFYEAAMVGGLCQMAFQFTSLVIYRQIGAASVE